MIPITTNHRRHRNTRNLNAPSVIKMTSQTNRRTTGRDVYLHAKNCVLNIMNSLKTSSASVCEITSLPLLEDFFNKISAYVKLVKGGDDCFE
jgi:hypothetical protein